MTPHELTELWSRAIVEAAVQEMPEAIIFGQMVEAASQQRIAALEAQVAALTAEKSEDTKRLDCYEEHPQRIGIAICAGRPAFFVYGDGQPKMYTTLRAALDAARKAGE